MQAIVAAPGAVERLVIVVAGDVWTWRNRGIHILRQIVAAIMQCEVLRKVLRFAVSREKA